jgi:hypothetical protein
MNFASDNTAPVTPAILDALIEASHGYARGYGNDDWTHALERRFCDIFEREVAAFLVPTGTAANALALAPTRTSPPTNAAPPNSSDTASNSLGSQARAVKSPQKACERRSQVTAGTVRIR